MKIEIVAGSPRTESVSYRVALFLQAYLQKHTNHEVNLIDVREWNLPMLQNVFTSEEAAPKKFQPLVKRVMEAQAFILVTPEYNGGFSPALQNLFDHFPKQARKAFGIVTASTGSMGGMRATQQLLLLVPGLFGIASPQMLVIPRVEQKFSDLGTLIDPGFEKAVQSFATEFLWLAESLQPEKVLL